MDSSEINRYYMAKGELVTKKELLQGKSQIIEQQLAKVNIELAKVNIKIEECLQKENKEK